MRRQRLQTAEQAAQNQAALKAKLIGKLREIGKGEEQEADSGEDDDTGDGANGDGGGEVAKYYPPSYYANQAEYDHDLDVLNLKEDRALRKKRKKILDAFNQKRLALKEQMVNSE